MNQQSIIQHFGECERMSHLIGKIYTGEVNVHGTQEAIKCKKLIENTSHDVHVFCHAVYCPVAVFALTTFTFEAQASLLPLKNRLNQNLSTCQNCIRGYSIEKTKLLNYFKIKRNLKYDQVSGFTDIIDIWRCESLVTKPGFNMEVPSGSFIKEILYNPRCLRMRSSYHIALTEKFSLAFNGYENMELSKLEFTPGLVFCYFQNQNVRQYEWAKNILSNLIKSGFQLDKKNETMPVIMDEICFQFFQIQLTDNSISNKVNFYFKIVPLLQLLSKETLKEDFLKVKYINSVKSYYPNFKEFLEQLVIDYYERYENKPIHLFFRIFTVLVKKLGSEFWEIFQPYKVHNIIDIAVEKKDMFLAHIIEAQKHSYEVNIFEIQAKIQDYIQWIEPVYNTIIDAEKMKLAKDISSFLLKVIYRNSGLTAVSRGILLSQCTFYLNDILKIDVQQRNRLYTDPTVESVLYQKSEPRDLIEHGMVLNLIVEYATMPDMVLPGIPQKTQLAIAEPAINILLAAIDFDIVMLCFVIHKLYVNPNANIHEVRYSTKLITSFSDKFQFDKLPVEFKTSFTKNLFKALKNANGLLTLVNENTPLAKKQHINKYSTEYTDAIVKLLGKIYAYDFGFFKEVLLDEDALYGFWSCIFTSNKNLYNTVIDLLYECFDQEDRMGNVKLLLQQNFSSNLNSIGIILHQLMDGKFYEPCPSAINVLTDTLQVLLELLGDEVFTGKFDVIAMKSLQAFWSNICKFLTSIYINTFEWANLFDLKQVMEFCKNAMDLNKAIIEAFPILQKFLGSQSDLFQDIHNSFPKLCQWLKLADPPLLDQCSKLVVSVLNLAHELQFTMDKSALYDLFTIAKKKDPLTGKKRKCFLTTTQSKDILDVLFVLNPTYISGLLQKLETFNEETVKKETVIQPLVQQKLPMFKKDFSSLNRPKPALSSLQKAEMQLKQKRVAKEKRVIHPARKSGFNMSESDSDSDDSDDNTEVNELFGRKNLENIGKKVKQKSGITLLGYDDKKKLSKIDQDKLDEKNMLLRLNVDVGPFYREILNWDYRKQGDYPTDLIPKVPTKDQYKSVEEYQTVMRPLLMLETWQGLCSSRDRDENVPFSIIIGNKVVMGDFYEIYASISKASANASGISEADLIVLSTGFDTKTLNRLRSDDFKVAQNSCLAKIKEMKGNRGDYMDMTLRISRSGSFGNLLAQRAEIFCCKVMSMTTVEREYKTLQGLPYYDLLPSILSSKISPASQKPPEEISRVEHIYKLNKSQAEAVVSSVSNTGFSLVQGPPGTGKTKTIMGIVRYYFEKDKTKNKLLLCAPSNAAVDELLLRLNEGYIDENYETKKFNIVRIGRSDAVNPLVKRYTLDDLIEQSVLKKYEFLDFDQGKYKNALEKRDNIRKLLEARSTTDEEKAKCLLDLKTQNETLNDLRKQKDQIRESNKTTYRNREFDRKTATISILKDADIICSTLSGAAHDLLAALKIPFPTVIVDEACQCTELSSIIPLKYGAKKVIMVGDPNQLPPTVLSGAASALNYENPLFNRFVKSSQPYLLDVQYRMHPFISKFPSAEFYDGKLKDGENMAAVTKRPWHNSNIFSPYKFFDVSRGYEERHTKTQSLVNMEEIYVAMELVQLLFDKYPKMDFKSKIGIISPYKAQVRTLQSKFVREFGENIKKIVEIQTIDGFQGQEKDIIIISCVRADETSSIGFLKDFRRMNVALTRAKCSMLILGHHESLVRNRLWGDLIGDAKSRNCFEKVDKPLKNMFRYVSDSEYKNQISSFSGSKGSLNRFEAQSMKEKRSDLVDKKVERMEKEEDDDAYEPAKVYSKARSTSEADIADDSYEPGSMDFKSSTKKRRDSNETDAEKKLLKKTKVSLGDKKMKSSFFINGKPSDNVPKRPKKITIYDKNNNAKKDDELPTPESHSSSHGRNSVTEKKLKGILKSVPIQDQKKDSAKKVNFVSSPSVHVYDQGVLDDNHGEFGVTERADNDEDDGYDPNNLSVHSSNEPTKVLIINGKQINTEKSFGSVKKSSESKSKENETGSSTKKSLNDYLNKSSESTSDGKVDKKAREPPQPPQPHRPASSTSKPNPFIPKKRPNMGPRRH